MSHVRVERKMEVMEGRLGVLRLKGDCVDLTVIGGYAPGEHAERKQRQEFWEALSQVLRKVPKRSSTILAIDGNAHIGHDPGCGIGSNGNTRWNNNGHDFAKAVQTGRMVVLNTLTSCKNAGWTWRRRDGAVTTRIDYLAVDGRTAAHIITNEGAIDWEEIGQQGVGIDHRPVCCNLKVPLLQ